MTTQKYFIFIYALFICMISSYAQNCSDKKTYNKCVKPDKSYMDKIKGRSLTFYSGKKKQIVFTAYANRSYFISICSAKKIKNLQLRLYESDTSNVIIYDNAAYEFKPTLTIDTDKTKKLKIEILLPPDPVPSKRKEYVCIGLLTGYKKL